MPLLRRKHTKSEINQPDQSGLELLPATLEGLQRLDELAEAVLMQSQRRRMLTSKIVVTACTPNAVTLKRYSDYQVSVLNISRSEDEGRHNFSSYATYSSEHIAVHTAPYNAMVNVCLDSTIPGRNRIIERYVVDAAGKPKEWQSTEMKAPLTANRCVIMTEELTALLTATKATCQGVGATAIRSGR
ncbi:hypothetical protein H7097_02745 [Aeromicrobium sp.]|nr:hypothetical protein [Candidatus Saccharibacteria bacterium]